MKNFQFINHKITSSYNPKHFPFLENYVQEQAKENTYDLDANLAVLKFYQFNPHLMNIQTTHLILLKAITNLPFSDLVLCKYLLLPSQMRDDTVKEIIYIADLLEQCDFVLFWQHVQNKTELFEKITGFYVGLLLNLFNLYSFYYYRIQFASLFAMSLEPPSKQSRKIIYRASSEILMTSSSISG